jgi:hypothetical protein
MSASVLAVCTAALCGCNSTSEAPTLDATADGPLQVGDGSATESGPEASPPDATMADGADGSTPDAATSDGSAEAGPTDGAGPNGDAIDDGPSDDGADGGSDSPSNDGSDGASDGSPDGASDGASDAGEGGIATRLLVPGTTLAISAATADDYLVYYDSSTQTYYARPLSGGPATTIYAAPLSAYAGYCTIVNKVAFCWSWNSNYVGTWSRGRPA